MKKFFAAVLLLLVLCGCSYINSRNSTNPPTQQEQICLDLRRNIIFDTASTPDAGKASSTQYAEMVRLYNKNGCDKLGK